MSKGSRWYDHNPRVTFAVNCLEKANNRLRKTLVRLLIKKAMDLNIKIQRPKKSFINRWYDTENDLRLAMEYFKNSNEAQSIIIAEYIINYLNSNALYLNEDGFKHKEHFNSQEILDI